MYPERPLKRRNPLVVRILLALAASYVTVCLAGCFAYRMVLYPAPQDGAPELAGASLLDLKASDNVRVPALYVPAPPGAPTVVHFHGNGETIRTCAWLARALSNRGVGALLVEYRGYGIAPGDPSEETLYRNAEAALAELRARGVDNGSIVLSGISLGSGVAAEMAARGHGSGLVLIAPYTSIPKLASQLVPILPASIIAADDFDTLGKAGRIQSRTLVVHGDEDELIPYEMGKTVASAIPGARLLTVAGGHHNDLFDRQADLIDVIAAHAKTAAVSRK